MAFDPTQPFEVLDGQEDKPAFDPSKPFEPVAEKPQKPAFDPSKPFSKALPQDLADDPDFDPIQHLAQNPDDVTTAEEAAWIRAQRPTTVGGVVKGIGQAIKGAVAEAPKAVAQIVRGTYRGAANVAQNVGAAIAGKDETDPDVARRMRENAAGIALGVTGTAKMAESAAHKYRTITKGKTRQEVIDHLHRQAAYLRQMQEIGTGELPEGMTNAPMPTFKTDEERRQFQQNIEDISETYGDPTNIPIVGEVLAPGKIASTVAGKTLKGVGKATEFVGEKTAKGIAATGGKLAKSKLARAGTPGAVIADLATGGTHTASAATAAAAAGGTWAGAKLLEGTGRLMRESGEEMLGAFPARGQSFYRKAAKEGIKGAAVGAVAGVPMMAGAETPEEAGAMVGGAVGLGGTVGVINGLVGAKKIETAAQAGAMIQNGQTVNYGTPEDNAHAGIMATLDPEAQNIVNFYRGYFDGATAPDGNQVTVQAVDEDTFIAETGQNSRGVYFKDGRILINVGKEGARRSAAEIAGAFAHEGKHAIDRALEAAQPKLHDELFGKIKGHFAPNGKPSPEFQQWIEGQMKLIADNMRDAGRSEKEINDYLAGKDLDYWLNEASADIAQSLITGADLGTFLLPQTMTSKLGEAVKDFAHSKGFTLKEQAGELGLDPSFAREVVKAIRQQLYQHGAETRKRLETKEAAAKKTNTVNAKIAELSPIADKIITGDTDLEERQQILAARKERDELLKDIGQQPASQTGTTGQQTPGTATPRDPAIVQAKADAMKELNTPPLKGLVPKDEQEQRIEFAIKQAEAQGITITASELITFATTRDFSEQARKAAQPPPSPNATVGVPVGTTFNDEFGNTYQITGESAEAPRIGDIVVDDTGKPFRITKIWPDGSADVAYTTSPLNSRASKTLKPGTFKRVDVEPATLEKAKGILRVEQVEALKDVGVRSTAILAMTPEQRAEALRQGLIDQQEATTALPDSIKEKLARPDWNIIAWTRDEIDAVNTALGSESPFKQNVPSTTPTTNEPVPTGVPAGDTQQPTPTSTATQAEGSQPSNVPDGEAPTLSIAPFGNSGRFVILDAAGNPINNRTYASEASAQAAMRQMGKGRFTIPPSANGNDIIDAIIEQGGINLSGLIPEERNNVFPHKGVWRNVLTTDNPDMTPDEVARILENEGHGDGDMRTMFDLITEAIQARKSLAEQTRAEEQRQKSESRRATAEETQRVTDLANAAKAAATAAEKNPRTQAAQDRIRNAIIDALLADIGDDPVGLHKTTDEDGKEVIQGEFYPDDPRHQAIAALDGLTQRDAAQIQQMQAQNGKPTHIRYRGAKSEGEGADTGMDTRREEYIKDPAAERTAGTIHHKAVIPLFTYVTKDGRLAQKFITLNNLLHNMASIFEGLPLIGRTNPYGKTALEQEPLIIQDANTYAENHRNGWKGDGSAPMNRFPDSGLPDPTPGYVPKIIPADRFAILNMAFANETSAKLGERTADVQKRQAQLDEAKTPAERKKAENILKNAIRRMRKSEESVDLSRENVPWIDEATGEPNKLRAELKAEGFDVNKRLKNPFENLSPKHILEVSSEPIPLQPGDIPSARPTGFDIDPAELGRSGLPNQRAVGAGFMPASKVSQFMPAGSAGAKDKTEARALKAWAEKGTDSPFFKKWTGNLPMTTTNDPLPETGAIITAFHGTPDARFSEFNPNTHFTENPTYASRYTQPTASSINVRAKEEAAPGVMKVFIKTERPFDTRNPKTRQVFEREFLGKYGNGTPLSERGLPDWTDSRDLIDWIEEQGKPFDSVILDEGGTPEGGWRGTAVVPLKPEQIKSATGNQGTFDAGNPDMRFMPNRDEQMFANGAVSKGPQMHFLPAHHGTPHKIDPKEGFKTSKIGTGEGAAAYGWGLYFAENPKVAEDYRKRLADYNSPGEYTWRGNKYQSTDYRSPERHALAHVFHHGVEAARQLGKRMMKDAQAGEPYTVESGGIPYYQRFNDVANGIKSKKEVTFKQGNTYTVDIDIPETQLLNWDKPLSEQPKAIQEMIRGMLKEQKYLTPTDDGPRVLQSAWRAYQQEHGGFANKDSGSAIYEMLEKMHGGAKEASAALLEKGIAGLKYKDEGSRGKRGGTHNYVVFDEKYIRITHENGTPVTASERSEALGQQQGSFMPSKPEEKTPQQRAQERQRDRAYLAAAESGDEATAQRLVDEAAKAAGYTVNGQHGTADNFNEFDLDHPNRKDTGWLGTGVYLTTNPQTARAYSLLKRGKDAPKVMNLIARLENPYFANSGEKQRLQFISHREGEQAGKDAAREWTRELIAKGYDGVIMEYKPEEVGVSNAGREIVIFDTAAVKSADPITKDDTGRIIPLSERFNPATGDIRFMPDNFKDDMTQQRAWMDAQAKEKGFASVQDLAMQSPAEFTKLAAQWRQQNRRENADGTLRYMPASPEDLQKHAEASNSVFQGEANGLLTFKELSTGGNFSLAPGDATPERIAAEAEKVRQSFAGKPEVTEANLDEFLRSQGIELPPTTQMKNGSITKGPMMQFLPAYHGTPHKVDRFSLEKVGTGEGAQVYGWGLYFAENPEVAEQYQNNLGGIDVTLDGRKLDVNNADDVESVLLSGLLYGEDPKKAVERIRSNKVLLGGRGAEAVAKGIELIESGRAKSKARGNTYTVSLDVEPEDLLDWDKPLSEQSEKVKAAVLPKPDETRYAAIQKRLNELEAKVNFGDEWDSLVAEATRMREAMGFGPSDSGADFYRKLGFGTPREASAYLHKLGIPGIRYLDQGSRYADADYMREKKKEAERLLGIWTDAKGYDAETQAAMIEAQKKDISYYEKEIEKASNQKRTYNYVIFDESKIRITHENGEPVTAAERKEALGEEQGGKAFTPESRSTETKEAAKERIRQRSLAPVNG